MMTCKDCKKWESCNSHRKNPSANYDGDSWANWCDGFVSKHKDMRFEYKGYTVVQSGYNWHVTITDRDGRMVFHASTERRLSRRQLEEDVDTFLELRERKA